MMFVKELFYLMCITIVVKGVEIPVGGDMVMDCRSIFTDTSTMLWFDTKPQDPVPILQQNKAIPRNDIQPSRYETRINNTVWGLCIIRNAMKEDSPSYDCRDDDRAKTIQFSFTVVGPPPVPTAVADNNPVNEGSNVTLSCQTTLGIDGTPTYSWKKSGSSVQSGDRISLNASTGDLKITGVMKGDRGEYKCSVTNVAGSRTSAGIELQVNYSPDSGPVISGYNNYSSVDVNYSITLTCTSNGGNPRATLTWSCSWSGFTDPGPGVGTLDLSLTMKKAYHQQKCTCTARHPVVNPDQVTRRTFNVLYAPGDPSLDLSAPLPWIESRQYTATCRSAMGNPDNAYEWSINSVLQKKQDTSNFTMSVTKEHNQGTLRCNVKNSYSDRHNQTLKAEKVLNVEFSPRVSVGDDMRPTEGNTTVLECAANSNPVAQKDNYRWSHVGGSRTHTGQAWSLGPLDKTYTGTYECQVTVQSAGQHGQLTGNSSLSVTVQYVELSLDLQNLTKTEYDRLKISCSGEGEPPNIQFNMWKHERQGVIRYIPGLVNGTQNRLVIDPVEYTDGGVYTCRGGNTVSQKEMKSFVIIHYAPKNADPTSGKQVFTPLGEDVLLSLNVTAVPGSVDFTWSRVGQNTSLIQLHNSSKTMIFNSPLSSRLTISNVTIEDLGNYTVHASNGILDGSNFMYRVSSRGGPSAPYIDEENSASTPVSVILSWRANFDGGYTQKFSIHFRETPGGNYILHRGNIPDPGYGKTSEERIRNLKSSTSYQFLVMAHNGHNDGTNVYSNEVTIQTLGLPSIDNASLTVRRDENTAYLRWGKPSGNYDEQLIEQRENGPQRKKKNEPTCEKPHCRTHDPGWNATNYTVTGLASSKTYQFVLVLLFMGETVQRQSFQKDTIKAPVRSNLGAVLGGVLGALVGAAVIVSLVIVLRRRNQLNKGSGDHEKGHLNNGINNQAFVEDDVGAHGSLSGVQEDKTVKESNRNKKNQNTGIISETDQDNPAALYAQPLKGKKTKQSSTADVPEPVLYAEVKKGRKDTDAHPVSNPEENVQEDAPQLYAEVVKKKKGNNKVTKNKGKEKDSADQQPSVYAKVQKSNKEEKGKAKKKKPGKPTAMYDNVNGEMVYQNVGNDRATKKDKEETYSEVKTGRDWSNPPPGTEGLQYAAVEFVKKPAGVKISTPAKDETSEYADIDYTKRGPPAKEGSD